MIKRIRIFVVLIFCLLLTGCASVDYSRIVEKSGKVTDRVVVSLELNKIASAGYNVNLLVANITYDLQLLYFSNVTNFIENSMYNENLTQEQKNNIKDNIVTKIEKSKDNTKIIASITFNNSEVFNLYYDFLKSQNPSTPPDEENGEQKSDVELKRNMFFTTYIQTADNAFGDVVNGMLAPIFNKYYATLKLGENFSLNDLTLTQIYGSYNTDLKSNADYVQIKDGIKLHYWEINPVNPNKLQFYSYSPNVPMWYIFALMVSISVAILILFYGLVKYNNPFNVTKNKIVKTFKNTTKN